MACPQTRCGVAGALNEAPSVHIARSAAVGLRWTSRDYGPYRELLYFFVWA